MSSPELERAVAQRDLATVRRLLAASSGEALSMLVNAPLTQQYPLSEFASETESTRTSAKPNICYVCSLAWHLTMDSCLTWMAQSKTSC